MPQYLEKEMVRDYISRTSFRENIEEKLFVRDLCTYTSVCHVCVVIL
jgi:hypothetical protein